MIQRENTTPTLEIQLFGPLTVGIGGQSLAPLHSRKGHSLLALLTLHHERPVERDWLAGILWPDSMERQALHNLRQTLSNLRQALGAEAHRLLSPTPHSLRFDLADANCDLIAFDTAIAQGGTLALEEAVRLYRGPLLEGCFEEWVFPERRVREEAYKTALETLATDALNRGDAPQAIPLLNNLLAVERDHERAQCFLMEALARNGDYVGLLQSYREFRLYLHEEFQTAPSEQTVALYQRLRQQGTQPPRLAPSETRPSPSADLLTVPSLPCPLTPLLGREQEIGEVIGCLNAARLVTLTGSGGVGKTRLALAVGESVADTYAEGVWFVDLAPLSDATLVVQTVATALQVKESPPQPLLPTLLNALSGRSLLVILDNCEHLWEACAELAQALLSGCPALRILATSRQPLNLLGERQWRVPSLAVPPLEVLRTRDKNLVSLLMEYSAVQLFVERAVGSGAVLALTGDNLGVVTQICRRLEGIPLAIEMAAARVRSLSVEEVNSKLDNHFRLLTGGNTTLPRQQTLRALLDWSYALLTPQEKTLLHRLSVFSGGWTLEGAEQVCAGEAPSGETLEEWEVLDLLTGLVDKSLALAETREGHTRYRLLETVRQYAHERLVESGEGELVRGRHCDHFLFLVHPLSATTPSKEVARVWHPLIEQDYDNVRVALDFCLSDSAYVEAGLRAAVSLPFYWTEHSLVVEGYTLLQAFLVRPEMQEPTQLRAQALHCAGDLAHWQGEYATAILLAEESLTLLRQFGDREGVSLCLLQLGCAYLDSGQPESARPFYEEGLAVVREWELLGMEPLSWVCGLLSGLANVCGALGEYEATRRYIEEMVALNAGEWDWYTHLKMANLLVWEGRFPEAREGYLRSLSLLRSEGECNDFSDANLLERLAAVEILMQGRWEQAALLFGACEAYREALQAPISPADHADFYDAALAGLHAALDADILATVWEQGRQMTFSQAIEYALEDATT